MTTYNLQAIQKAKTTEALRYLDKDDNAFTWIGPFTLLGLFLGIIVIITTSTGWFLTKDTSSGWIQFLTIINILITLAIIFFIYQLVQTSGTYITYHMV